MNKNNIKQHSEFLNHFALINSKSNVKSVVLNIYLLLIIYTTKQHRVGKKKYKSDKHKNVINARLLILKQLLHKQTIFLIIFCTI